MKKLAIVIGLMFCASLLPAQSVDVKVDPDIEVNVDPDVDIDVSSIVQEVMDGFSGRDKYKDKSRYTQNTQEIEIPLSRPGERGTLKVDSRNGQIKITGYDGKTVKVKIIKYEKKVSKDKDGSGMKLLSSGGLNFEASEYDNVVEIENEGWNNRSDFEIMVPKNFDIRAESYNNGDIEIDGIDGELDIESYNGPISLTKINGAASASTYNGVVLVEFASVTPEIPMTFHTYNGKIDISVPDGTKFSAKMKTNRDIYTDFENFQLSEAKPDTRRSDSRRGYSIKYENWVRGELNGGGPEFTMETRNGNIYIRKK